MATRERTASHEAGHALTGLACGVPLIDVWISATPINREYGKVREDLEGFLRADNGLSKESKLIRIMLFKAGGVAGEGLLLGAYDLQGLGSDWVQVASALKELGVIEEGEAAPPQLLIIAVEAALEELKRHVEAQRRLRAALLSQEDGNPISNFESVPVTRTPSDDEALLVVLRDKALALRREGLMPRVNR